MGVDRSGLDTAQQGIDRNVKMQEYPNQIRKINTNVINKNGFNPIKNKGNIQISDILNSVAYSDF